MPRPLPPYDAGFQAALAEAPPAEEREERLSNVALIIGSYTEGSPQHTFWRGYLAALEATA